jgi:hypothetical protein
MFNQFNRQITYYVFVIILISTHLCGEEKIDVRIVFFCGAKTNILPV